jgi:thiol:disulfide interchange protein
MNDTQKTTTTASDSSGSDTAATPWREVMWRNRFRFLWIGVAALFIIIQWPMLKGVFYGVAGAAAPPDGIEWRTSFPAALDEARESGKPMLVNFTADWCPPCRVMKHDVWPDEQVQHAITESFVPVMIDVDDPSNAMVGRQYGVMSIPTILVVDADGKVLRQGNFMTRNSLLQFLEDDA